MLKKAFKRLHFAILFHETFRRSQISQFCACKCNRLTERWLSRKIAICATFGGRKAAFSGQKCCFFAAIAAPLVCNGAVFIMQRGAHCNPAAAPLQTNGAATVKPSSSGDYFGASRPLFFAIFICHGFFSNNVYKTCRDRGIPNVNVMWTWRNRGGTGCGALNCRNNMAVSKKILKFAENMCLSHARMAGGRVAWSGCRT